MRIKSTEEQAEQLNVMYKVIQEFRYSAVKTLDVGFVAHSSLLNTYREICKRTSERSHGDFNNANHPAGEPLALERGDAEGLATTLAAIYGTTFASRKDLLEAFITKLSAESERLLQKVKGDETSSG